MPGYRYLKHSDLLTLAASIADWTERLDFYHSVVDNDYNHLATVDGEIVVRVRMGHDNPDHVQILALEKALEFICGRVDPQPADG